MKAHPFGVHPSNGTLRHPTSKIWTDNFILLPHKRNFTKEVVASVLLTHDFYILRFANIANA